MKNTRHFRALAAGSLTLGLLVPAQGGLGEPTAGGAEPAWRELESPLLVEHLELTSRDEFMKAGESYFDHHSPPRWVVFQAVPVPPEGKDPDAFYSMYIAKLRYEGEGPEAKITGLEKATKLSWPGSSNTCGWFFNQSAKVMFASTLQPPKEEAVPGYQRGTGRYRWEFPREMRLMQITPSVIEKDMAVEPARGPDGQVLPRCGTDYVLGPLFGNGDGYIAECSVDKTDRFVLFAKMVDPAARDLDICIVDLQTGQERVVVKAPGYDGGPFFSPDGKRICYRSDRAGDSLLQVYVADLEFDEAGVPIGIVKEHQITSDKNVNWAPYWHPSGEYVIFGSSAVSHGNYELFAATVPPRESEPVKLALQPDEAKDAKAFVPKTRRISQAAGADILPAFSDDGRWLMWTAQRGAMVPGETKPSSQVWVARVNAGAGGLNDPVGLFAQPEGK